MSPGTADLDSPAADRGPAAINRTACEIRTGTSRHDLPERHGPWKPERHGPWKTVTASVAHTIVEPTETTRPKHVLVRACPGHQGGEHPLPSTNDGPHPQAGRRHPAARGPKATASNGSNRAHRDIGQRHNRTNDRQTWTGITWVSRTATVPVAGTMCAVVPEPPTQP